MVFPLDFCWCTSSGSEDFTHVNFSCNEADYKGFLHASFTSYMAGSVAKMAVVFWFLSHCLLLILDV